MENTKTYSLLDYKRIFSFSGLSTGLLKIQDLDLQNPNPNNNPNPTNNKNKNSHNLINFSNILFRTSIHDSHLFFILYDYKNLYFSRQSFSNIEKLNKELNTSLEFEDVNTLLTFILENLINKENNTLISKSDNKFAFESLFDILVKVRWSFDCEKFDTFNLKGNITENFYFNIVQDLFAKPLINTLFALQQFLIPEKGGNCASNLVSNKNETTNSVNSNLFINDVSPLLNNTSKFNNTPQNFNKVMTELIKKSTEILLLEENLKRKNIDNANHILEHDIDLVINNNLKKNTKNNKAKNNLNKNIQNSIPTTLEKSSEITDEEFSSNLSNYNENIKKTPKKEKSKSPIRKKKNKLNFV